MSHTSIYEKIPNAIVKWVDYDAESKQFRIKPSNDFPIAFNGDDGRMLTGKAIPAQMKPTTPTALLRKALLRFKPQESIAMHWGMETGEPPTFIISTEKPYEVIFALMVEKLVSPKLLEEVNKAFPGVGRTPV